ncbi:MAG: NUDIX hydrolase [Anaerolineaceae bacterium]
MNLHCLKCGNVLTPIALDGQTRDMCLKCGWVYYPHRSLGAGCLIQKEGRLLLVCRASEPWRGAWYIPSGFVEVDESPVQAAVREVKEETGLEVKVENLFGVYSYDDDPRGNGVLILYSGRITGGKFIVNHEVSDIAYFSPAAIPENLAGTIHKIAITDWMAGLNGRK